MNIEKPSAFLINTRRSNESKSFSKKTDSQLSSRSKKRKNLYYKQKESSLETKTGLIVNQKG
ncbi:hypothetical protein A7Q09_02355 [Methylacidiphilum sp. Yel]|nr:hypothetical protein A7Q09_02355 [Methylacidiphilum sp. Yel]